MSDPAVSVVMATYNHGAYIKQALDSLSDQSLQKDLFEVVVINDGSTDNTADILQDYSPWIRVVNQPNQGLVASCNTGLTLARGTYFTRLDSDDYAHRDWLLELMTVLQTEQAAVCAVPDLFEVRADDVTYVTLNPENIYTLQACGTMFRTAGLRRSGGFRPFYWEEYDLYLRLRSLGKFIHIPRALYFYRKHPGGMTHNSERRMQGWMELAQTWGFDHLKSAGYHEELNMASDTYQG